MERKDGGVLIFGGTSEGRRLAAFLSEKQTEVTVSVISEYGSDLLQEYPNVKIIVKAMDEETMKEFLQQNQFALVVDATHPYACLATDNIQKACKSADVEYIRLLRPSMEHPGGQRFQFAEDIVRYLNKHDGNILLTTGTNQLETFTAVKGYDRRIYPRMLPMAEAVEKCRKLGYRRQNLICMQGPFDVEMNAAMLRHTRARYLVTKDSSNAGGVPAKIQAAEMTGAEILLLGRPYQEEGYTWEQVVERCLQKK